MQRSKKTGSRDRSDYYSFFGISENGDVAKNYLMYSCNGYIMYKCACPCCEAVRRTQQLTSIDVDNGT